MIVAQLTDEWGQVCQVRRAGRSLRLYTDGVFHSQYHPQRLLEDNLWDLLWLPTLAQPEVKRVLVLGVGGGAVMRKLNQLYPEALVIGVDISAAHLTLARDYFGVRGPQMSLYAADALEFVRFYRGPRFDVIVDDLFVGSGSEPTRVQAVDEHWCNALTRLLSPNGLWVVNFASGKELMDSFAIKNRALFPAAFSLAHRRYENGFGAFYRRRLGSVYPTIASRLAEHGCQLSDQVVIRSAR
ncbi:spermidine synthase [Gilvimarinus xylanilyticus]|uniref:Methyltransferase domain-containing protein n=1 Tax=Gilvimarinus xylanilyticus TaxID=2944139 RepID=A0A9X2KSJ6_9GAMM|nr:methyltransferase domain-containing protein [Gilvimarinus xylanilyticus]MCP8898886.1 methyltransferase domain-containing protein [Gilvimarinus xylanilyticus]